MNLHLFATPFDGIRACHNVLNGRYSFFLAQIYHGEISRKGIAWALIGQISKMRYQIEALNIPYSRHCLLFLIGLIYRPFIYL
jgi:hypothetical protein